jgi:hypothetical protein
MLITVVLYFVFTLIGYRFKRWFGAILGQTRLEVM